MKQSQALLARGVAIAAIVCSMPAVAQERTSANTGNNADENVATENNVIIVTATRRASPLSDVPVAVSAITAASLQDSGANDIRQLNQLAPSLLVSSTGTEANGSARIRGVGTVGDNPGLESSVAVFIDGVYRSRTGAGLTDLGEIERIEVLRGPQGTLFGRNASAGLINIVTKSPQFTFGANGDITYGDYNYWRVSGSVTGPVSDKAALRLDGVWSKRDGFLKLVDSAGNRVGETNDRDRYLIRAQALLEPTDALSIRLIGDYTHRDESCCGAAYISTREVVTGNITQPNRIATILNAIAPGSVPAVPDPYSRAVSITPGRDYASKLKDWGLSAEINYDFGGTKLTSITAYRDYKSRDYGDYDYTRADILYRDPNTFRQFRTFTQELRLQGAAFENKLDWLVGGYYSNEKLTLEDNFRFGADYGRFSACRLMVGTGPTPNLSAPQLALCGVPIDGNPATPDIGNLIAGTQAAINAGLVNAGVPPTQAAAISGGLGNGLTALATLPANSGDSDAHYRQKSESFAAFTHNIVHLTDKLDLTVGLRWTHESKKLSANFANNNATCAALQASGLPGIATNPQLGSAAALGGGILTLACLGNSSTGLNALQLKDGFNDDELSGTAVLSYKPSRETMVYASYSRGYKAGGYNLDKFELGNTGLSTLTSSPFTYFFPRSNADAPSLRFAAEKVNSYEIGLKYSTRKWGANVAAFREEFKDFQLNTFNGTSFVVQNINGCDTALTTGSIDKGGRRCAQNDVTPGLISQGVEIEAYVSPVRNVRVTGGFTYTEAKFRKTLVGSSDGQTPLDAALFLLPGNINSNAPKYVTTMSFAWTPDIGSGGLSGLVYFDGRMTGDYNTGSDLFPEKRQDGFSVWNARLGVRGPQQRWAVEFWGQNIFNTKYTQVAFNTPLEGSGSAAAVERGLAASATQIFSAYLAEPRTYGITLRGKF